MKSKTILRVMGINTKLGIVKVLIPQWSSHKIINIKIFNDAKVGQEVDVLINMDAKDETELYPEILKEE